MKTVTITEAKKHLGAYLKEALAGANIGVICGNRIVALRPVEITSIDAEQTGDPDLVNHLTAEQRDSLFARLKQERKEAKRRRKQLLAGNDTPRP
jgi:antitoxin (DNA-binding transcriptional repressor) of toxin-antitoxin stability system